MKAGFITDIKAYLFKIDGDVVKKVYDIWDQGSKFDKLDFSLTPVTQIFHPRVEGTETKSNAFLVYSKEEAQLSKFTREQIFKMLVNDAIEKAELILAKNYEDFRVKAPVAETRGGLFPIVKSKIGKKEGLTLDTRYFVYEKTLGKDGKITSDLKGVLRVANNIVDNRTVTTGNTGTTKFYQVQGKKIEPGMCIQQKIDFNQGFNIGVGYALDAYQNAITKVKYKAPLAITIRYDYNTSPYLARKLGKWFTEMRIYGEMKIIGKAEKLANGQNDSINLLQSNKSFSFGLSKDFHLLRNIKLSPFIQIGMIGSPLTAFKDRGKNNTFFAAYQHCYGVRLPISLNYWIELVPGLTIFTPASFNSKLQDKVVFNPMYIDAAIRMSF